MTGIFSISSFRQAQRLACRLLTVILIAAFLVAALPAGLLPTAAAQSQPGEEWELLNPIPQGHGFSGVICDGDKIEHVGDYGTILKASSVGITSSPPPTWSARSWHTSVVLPDGSIVLMGGSESTGDGTSRPVGDVWRSTDQGATWTRMTAQAEWVRRSSATSVAMPDGSIVLMGGWGAWPGLHNDVWRSTDQGATWTRMTAAAEWGPRDGATSVVMPDGSIVLIGGRVKGEAAPDGGYYSKVADDVWRSTDQGATWTEVTSSIGWTDRSVCDSPNGIVYADGTIVVIGGRSSNPTRCEVWRSTDQGVTWSMINEQAPFWAGQNNGSAKLPDGSIVHLNGNSAWRSTNQGVTWTEMTGLAEWGELSGFSWASTEALPDGSIVVIGGSGNAVWRSTDKGASWIQVYPPLPNYILTVNSTNPGTGVSIGSYFSGHYGTTPYTRTLRSHSYVTLTAFEYIRDGSSCKKFSSWSGAVTSTDLTINLYMDKNKTVAANYEDISTCPEEVVYYTLNVNSTNPNSGLKISSVSGNGGTTSYTNKLRGYSMVALTAPEYVGSGADRKRFDRWSGSRTSTNRTITLYMIINKSVTANYVDDPGSIEKKAIYVLPGYMGSQLYRDLVIPVWPFSILTELFIYPLYLRSDEHGDSIDNININKTLDNYGTFYIYKALVQDLENHFQSTHDIHFFPYNWLGDLNDSASALEAHINGKGYDKVVFVTHSTGGLLAATYIARSHSNKNKVEKAILIAAPLFGTYSALEPIEIGMSRDLQNKLKYAEVVANPTVYRNVRLITRNSPTTYQLLPSAEYLKQTPLYLKENTGHFQKMDTPGLFYSVLNRSGNINPNLTTNSERSHRRFRENIFGNSPVGKNIVEILQQVNTTLIGNRSGFSTTVIFVYEDKPGGGVERNLQIASKAGDGTVSGYSAGAFLEELDYINYPANHTGLVKSNNVHTIIRGLINFSSPSSIMLQQEPPSDGMTTSVTLDFKADALVDVEIVDSDANVVASLVGGEITGFDDDDFLFSPIVFEEDEIDATIYLPHGGYQVNFSYGSTANVAVDFSVDAATLDHDGFMTSSATYSVTETGANGLLISLDMLNLTVEKENVGSLAEGPPVEVQIYYELWQIEDEKILPNVGATHTLDLFGDDVTAGNITAADLSWSSSDPDIVTVSDTGVIEAKNHGVAMIYVSATDGSYRLHSCKVTVPLTATSIEIDNVTMIVDERVLIRPAFTPENTTEKDVAYDYDQAAGVIEIDEFAVITGLSPGTVEVTGTAPGGAQAVFQVAVKTGTYDPIGFSDVAEDHPFFNEIKALVASGITTGYDDGTFRPSANVTRMAMAAFLYRGLELEDASVTEPGFSDVPLDHFFFTEIEALAASGITTGYEDGTFRPLDNVTRMAMAAFLFRALDLPDPGVIEPTFIDVPANHSFFTEIEALVASGITTGYDDGTFRPSANVTRMAMAAFLVRGLGIED